ncbi:SDR family NAD(P)-dependent oxidoreductase [Marivivens sp. LCG002]|uniref:SDR family NAD(P)-dependent oxidoreductase n=1 Tax=Marivivens sp. LCG002 TaxID=3051171 RepID=UPI0025571B38|nr:SDR family NAD(P)-dependent oxidoreductase [Marivivens sp. LCG002]WIV50610.1 SDR family NAD(P)-dependent oxidoreductase [Marivivens sp. LCG002]
MGSLKGKRYWLVGASEGLGRALAHEMSAAGVEVVVSARNQERLDELVRELPNPAQAVTVDVSDREAVEAAADAIGPVDGVVYLAGVYWPMKAQEWDNAQAEQMGEINYLGASRVVGAVLPKMIERGAGHVVLTGSLSGFRGLPGAIGYGASKAAVMYLAESMRADLGRGPIKVQVVNPGFIKTRLTDKNDFKMPFIMEPEEAARLMFEHMQSNRFKTSFPRVFSWFFRGSQFLPDWLYYRLF